MESRPVIGLYYTPVRKKSSDEAQAQAPDLYLKSMSAFCSLHEEKKNEEKRSYRLPDSLCNGSVKLFAMVAIVVCRI
jgi:hypothetical protein